MSTSSSSPARRLIFPAKQTVILENFSLDQPGAGEVLVRMHCTLMSTGTENIVFNRLFDPGTHWDNWVKYPFQPGYTAVGTVEKLGEGVTTLKVGDRVACRRSHASHCVLGAADCFPIPDQIPFEEAVWFALAKIAFGGAREARYELGDSVLIIGAGPIGQMSIRWANAAGATPIVVVDAVPNRMAAAKAGGATVTLSVPIDQAKEKILEATGGVMPRKVIDSTGNAAVFAAALKVVADHGTVVILGDTGQPTHQFLTGDVINRNLTVRGSHDRFSTAEWHGASITRLLYDLVESGRFSLKGLTSHVFKPEQCAEAYATANRDRASTMGILFDWTDQA
jgi:2-desacetyl-2-hydroxyethyl bacteriochlorophyllide A dehydrogenase